MFIIEIIVGLIVLGLVITLLETIFSTAKAVIPVLIIFVIMYNVFGFTNSIGIILLFAAIMSFYEWYSNNQKEIHESTLSSYLVANCLGQGYMDGDRWRRLLPQFVNLSYVTSFDNITTEFTNSVENQCLKDESLAWIEPALSYLMVNVMAEVSDLEQVLKQSLNSVTHSTPDNQLIYECMECTRQSRIINGKPLLDIIELQGNDNSTVERTGTYAFAYKINDEFIDKSITADNFESEEISEEDLLSDGEINFESSDSSIQLDASDEKELDSSNIAGDIEYEDDDNPYDIPEATF